MKLPVRPAAVALASYLLAGIAAVWLSGAGAMFFAIPHFDRAVSARTGDPVTGSLVAGLLAGAACVVVLTSAIPLVLAYFDSRGRPTARVLTWVLCSIAAVAAVVLLLGGGPFTAIPWMRGLYAAVSLLTLALSTAVVALLSRPSAAGYFRDTATVRRASRPVAPRYPYQAYPPGQHYQPGQPPQPGPPGRSVERE